MADEIKKSDVELKEDKSELNEKSEKKANKKSVKDQNEEGGISQKAEAVEKMVRANLKGKGMKRNVTIATIIFVIIALLFIASKIFFTGKYSLFNNSEGVVTTFSKSTLKDTIEINQLSTLEYTYNSMVKVTDEKSGVEKYNVAYDGLIIIGINMDLVEIKKNDVEKSIEIKVPEPEIQQVKVDIGSLSFIFNNEKYETETVSHEAYSFCYNDLSQKAKNDVKLMGIAKENAIQTIQSICEPWASVSNPGYKLIVK